MYVNKCSKCGSEFETKNPKRVICPACLYPDRQPILNQDTQDKPREEDQPREGYPQGGYDRPQQGGYSRPQGGYDRPQRGGHGRPQGGYDRPQQGGYGRPQGGYDRPQQGGYGRPQGGYDRPQQGGYGRPQGGYDRPQQGGYGRPQGGYDRPQQGGYGRPQGGYDRPQQGGYARPQGGYDRPQQGGYGRPQGGYDRPQQGGYDRPQGGFRRPQQGGYGRPQGGFRRPQQGGYGRPQGGFRRPQQKRPLLVSREQVAQIEVLYKRLLPLPNPDAHEVIGKEIELEPNKVFFGINLVRQKLNLPKLPFPKRKLAVSPDQLEAIKNAYEPLLPLPPIGCHKLIADQLKIDEWRVHVGIGIIRKQMELPRWNPEREDAPEEFKNQPKEAVEE